MLEDAAVVSLDASAVPLEDAVAPPLELVLVLPLSPHPVSYTHLSGQLFRVINRTHIECCPR